MSLVFFQTKQIVVVLLVKFTDKMDNYDNFGMMVVKLRNSGHLSFFFLVCKKFVISVLSTEMLARSKKKGKKKVVFWTRI